MFDESAVWLDDLKRYALTALEALKANWVLFLAAGFVTQILTVLTLGILGGLLTTAYWFLWVDYYREQKAPMIKDLFTTLLRFKDKFAPLTIIFYAVYGGIFFGTMMLFVPGLLVATLFLWTAPIMIDQKKFAVMDAFMASKDFVMDPERGGGIIRVAVIMVLIMLAMLILGVLTFWMPIVGHIIALVSGHFVIGTLAAMYVERAPDPNAKPAKAQPARRAA